MSPREPVRRQPLLEQLRAGHPQGQKGEFFADVVGLFFAVCGPVVLPSASASAVVAVVVVFVVVVVVVVLVLVLLCWLPRGFAYASTSNKKGATQPNPRNERNTHTNKRKKKKKTHTHTHTLRNPCVRVLPAQADVFSLVDRLALTMLI